MFSYNNPAFVEAEARYRRERLARDWSPRRGLAVDATQAGQHAFRPGRTLRSMVRHYRHA
jgi:hypothetical protein